MVCTTYSVWIRQYAQHIVYSCYGLYLLSRAVARLVESVTYITIPAIMAVNGQQTYYNGNCWQSARDCGQQTGNK